MPYSLSASQPDLRLCRAATPPYRLPEPRQCPVRTAKPACLPEHPRCRLSPCRDCPRYCGTPRRSRRENAGAVSLVEHDAPIVLRELCRVRSGRIRLAAEPCEFACVRREHDRLCRSPQYILMPGNRIYAVRIEHNLAFQLFSSRVHTISVSVSERPSPHPMSSASAFSASASSFGSASMENSPFSSCGIGRTTGSFSLTASTGHAPLRNCRQRHNAASHTDRALRGKIRRACISCRAAHAQNAAVVVSYLSPDCANAAHRPRSPGLSLSYRSLSSRSRCRVRRACVYRIDSQHDRQRKHLIRRICDVQRVAVAPCEPFP